MSVPRITLLLTLLLGTEGCDTFGIACTGIFVYGLSVQVVEEGSGLPRAQGSTLTIRDGDYVESTTESLDGVTMYAAGERPGTYEVTVAHDGYRAWSRPRVTVREDECHVMPVALVAELEPIV